MPVAPIYEEKKEKNATSGGLGIHSETYAPADTKN
jgi:hypothetical protein